MKAIIRIKGQIGLKENIKETLKRLRLMKKYTCVVLRENPVTDGMIKKVKDAVAYGDISKEMFTELIKIRGKPSEGNKKIDANKIVEEFFEKGSKKLQDLNIKPFFRLHPPRKGINTKFHFPKGVLGDHKEKINDLIKRML